MLILDTITFELATMFEQLYKTEAFESPKMYIGFLPRKSITAIPKKHGYTSGFV